MIASSEAHVTVYCITVTIIVTANPLERRVNYRQLSTLLFNCDAVAEIMMSQLKYQYCI
jgi:hypothetical protein